MTAASPAAIARAFVTARQQATGFSDYPGPIPPSLADGYANQAEALALVDAPVGGWKVGRVPAPLVERFGADRLAGPIFTPTIHALTPDAAGLVFAQGFGAAEAEFAGLAVAPLRAAAQAGLNAPLSSSAGRLFDAVAALLGICPAGMSFEGEAAMRLEALARAGEGRAALALPAAPAGPVIDPAPMIAALMAARAAAAPEALAFAFHRWLAEAFAARARALVEAGRARAVVLSGGVYQNALLHRLSLAALKGLPVLTHAKVPANDGGLALGQALIAAAQLSPGPEST